jgi:hypothetical protein
VGMEGLMTEVRLYLNVRIQRGPTPTPARVQYD